ncbi:SURP and G-patch domain-containing protein 2 isoform X2 [Antechinus flavipes]|uniref:SURP and G-patch domain-containing protein 2 isoform X2 n=1 Tax=Antechinus flavipes TaxID=38775 RepID=UPI0022364E3E|nr:SURP and G-patch domain-containing protein 2 isoform X2 [Antechinus flavipes]
MASRRVTRETFDAVIQEKVKRYRMDHSDAIEDTLHQFKSQGHSRSIPRSRADRYEDSFHDDGRYSRDPVHPRDTWREDLRDDVFPGPSFRSNSPPMSEENYYQEDFGRDRDFSRADSRDRDFNQAGSRDRDFGHRDFSHFGSQDPEFSHSESWEHDFAHPSSHEPSWSHENDFGPEILGDFRSPGLMEEEYVDMDSQEYDLDFSGEADYEFQQPVPRGRGRVRSRGRGGRGAVGTADRGGILQSKRVTRGALKTKVIKGDVRKIPTIRKVNTKKLPPMVPYRIIPKTRGTNRIRKTILRPDLSPGVTQRTENVQRPVRKTPLRPNQKISRLPRGEVSFDLVDNSDIFSTFGIEIIKWAGFHKIKNDMEFSQLFAALFELETETCAKMLASFKCSLKPEHRDFCFFTIKCLKHSALKTPKVDNEFLNMLLDKGAVKTKNCFFEIIKPFDKYMMRLQDRLLKSVTPLLMACNAYELSVKMKGFSNPAEVAGALETTNSLCRKSLALLGQTFSLASTFRQEKILEAIGLQEVAPVPAAFPNFDDSTLFGREYIEHLKAWLENSGHPIQMKKADVRVMEGVASVPSPNSDVIPEALNGVPQRADRKVVETIEKFVKSIIEGNLSPKERATLKKNPTYWFLSDEDSLEYKYYKLKLAEMQRIKEIKKDEEHQPTSEECAVRAMLYAKKVQSLKKRLIPRKRLGLLSSWGISGWKMRKSTVGTQTLLSAGTMLKHQVRHAHGVFQVKPSVPDVNHREKNLPSEEPGSLLCDPSAGPLTCPPRTTGTEVSSALPEPLHTPSSSQFANVDAKTMDTAEKLAKFVAQVGPEIEQFSIENSADNPDLWFLHDQNSPAFKFYRMKVYELCPSINFTKTPLNLKAGEGLKSGKISDHGEEEEQEEEELEGDHSQQGTELELELGPEEEEEEGTEDDTSAREASSRIGEETGRAAQSEGIPSEEAQNTGAEGDGASLAALSQSSASSACFPRKRISSKSLKVGMIPAPKRVCLIEEPKVHEPVRIAYDRPRGRPVSKKKKHKDLEFAQQKLTDRNVGFQMLQKMGWKEGYGLGSRGKGIKEPVKVGTTSEGEGLGVEGEENNEDTFDVFRQRMIQMYRQKRASK